MLTLIFYGSFGRHEPWTEITRPQYRRANRRYANDLTDAEWELLKPLMPEPSRLGRPRTTDLRQVVDALLYMAPTAASGGSCCAGNSRLVGVSPSPGQPS